MFLFSVCFSIFILNTNVCMVCACDNTIIILGTKVYVELFHKNQDVTNCQELILCVWNHQKPNIEKLEA